MWETYEKYDHVTIWVRRVGKRELFAWTVNQGEFRVEPLDGAGGPLAFVRKQIAEYELEQAAECK